MSAVGDDLRARQEPRSPGSGDRVLVVDDERASRALCRHSLERAGYVVWEADSGEAALAAVREQAPDVIIMDVLMPGMDGRECTRRLKADPTTRDIPLIMVSAHSETGDILAGLESGADEYLTKPIRTQELTLRVSSMVRLHREHRHLLASCAARGEQTRNLTRLLDFCRALSATTDPNVVLAQTVAAAAEVCSCRRVCVMLPDASRGFLTVAESSGLSAGLAPGVQVPVGHGISGRVYQSAHRVVIDTPDEAWSRREPHDAAFFIRPPLVSAPLGTPDQVVGVLNVTERLNDCPFGVDELKYIDLIASIAGSVLHDLVTRQARDQARDSIVIALAKLAEHRDSDTGRHIDRVTHYCLILAHELLKKSKFAGLIDEAFLDDLERAGPLHDIGKVAIPDHILLKPGRFTPEEMEVMKPHTQIGAETIRSIIRRAPGVRFLEMAEQIAHGHHERWDGTGYPRGWAGEQIPLCARILALADVYDALTTKRVYKEAFSHDRAVAILVEGSGTQFDPDLVEAFLKREDLFAALARELADTPSVPVIPSTLTEQKIGSVTAHAGSSGVLPG